MTSHNRNERIDLEEGWQRALKEEFSKEYIQTIRTFLVEEKSAGKIIYPSGKDIFSAFNTTPFERVAVVILGQDPYHGPGQAHGLSFSVPQGVRPPPSLGNIYKELCADLQHPRPEHGNLKVWAERGVLLLNAVLTVEKDKPGSHQNRGWEQFTDAAVRALNDQRERLVFVLWGAYAQQKGKIIDRSKHCVIESAHPSPFSAYRGFLGSRPFSRANAYLEKNGLKPIDWKL